MKRLNLLLVLGLALVGISPAAAFDQPLNNARIKDNSDIPLSDDLNLGKLQGGKVTIRADAIQIQSSGSTGPVDGVPVGLGSLSDMLSGTTGLGTAALYGILPSNSAAVNTARIQAAIAELGATGGGTINFPCGDFYFGSIDNNVQGILLKGPAVKAGLRDGGIYKFCTRFIAAQTGTFVKHRTPYGQGLSKFFGGGFENIFLDGNGVATRVLEVDTVSGAIYKGAVGRSVGTEAVIFKSGVSGIDVADAADVQRAEIDLQCRQIDGTAQAAANCFVLKGSSNANFSANENVRLSCQHANGACLVGYDADNNRISLGAFRIPGGTGYTFTGVSSGPQHAGFRENTFVQFGGSGPTYMAGVGESGATAGVRNEIMNLDIENGSPVPTAGVGSVWYGSFKQSYTPTIKCAAAIYTGTAPTIAYVRSRQEVSVYFDWSVSTACTGGVTISLPVGGDAALPSVGSAVERGATGNVYMLLVGPNATSAALQSIPAGTVVGLSAGWVVSGHVRYVAKF